MKERLTAEHAKGTEKRTKETLRQAFPPACSASSAVRLFPHFPVRAVRARRTRLKDEPREAAFGLGAAESRGTMMSTYPIIISSHVCSPQRTSSCVSASVSAGLLVELSKWARHSSRVPLGSGLGSAR